MGNDNFRQQDLSGGKEKRAHHLELLGPFRLHVRGQAKSLPHGVERVIALLAVVGPVARPRAASLLWPDVDTPRAAANMRAALSRLTATASGLLHLSGEVLTIAGDTRIDLNDAMSWINVIIYDSAPIATPAPPPSIGTELLPGWDEEWLIDARERLSLLQSQALESAAERLISVDRAAEALPYALAAVQIQPWSESANRLIIEIHARRGDHSNALRRYRKFRRELEQELGVRPGPDILAAIRQLYPFSNIDGLSG